MPLFYYKGKIMTYKQYYKVLNKVNPLYRLLKFPLPTIPEVEEDY